MAKGATVANAFVQIMPSTDGIKENLTASLGEAGEAGGAAAESGFLGKLGGLAKKVAGIVAGAAAVKAVVDFGKAAVDAYGEFEQLQGGVETLFGTGGKTLEQYAESVGMSVEDAKASYIELTRAANDVQENARNAFKTSGMSMNEYMETVTGFSASLITSLGGDTAKAAEIADMAIIDMSDNANKMGSDMESIQNAYQGFAKQNYTMLDNLKLGYGGTREEMQRLLENAEAISGVHYDIENYADIVNAIHVIQDEMGIAGATAEEAASTIQGSWGMLTSSWDNLILAVGGGGMEVEEAFQDLFDSLFTYLENLLPEVLVTIYGIFDSLPRALESSLAQLPVKFRSVIEKTFGEDAANAAYGYIEPIVTSLQALVGGVMSTIGIAWGYVKEFSAGLISALGGKLPSLLSALGPIVNNVAKIFTNKLCTGIRAVTVLVEPLATVFTGVANVISTAFGVLADVSTAFFDAILDAFEQTDFGSFGEDFTSASDMIAAAIEGIKGPAMELATYLGGMLGEALTALGPILQTVGGVLADYVAPAAMEFGGWLVSTVIPAVGDFAASVAETLGPVLASFGEWLVNVAGPALADFGSWLADTAIPAVCDFASSVGETLGPVLEDIGTFFSEVIGPALADFGSWLADTAVPAVCDFANAVGETLGPILEDLGQWIADRAEDFGHFMDKIGEVADWFGARFKDIQDAFSSIHFEWPHISLPHFGINPAGWEIGDLLKGVIPSLSIEWYAKGGLFEDAALVGVGEKGTELAWPSYEPYLSKYASAIARFIPEGTAAAGNNYSIYIGESLVSTSPALADRLWEWLADVQRIGGANVGR